MTEAIATQHLTITHYAFENCFRVIENGNIISEYICSPMQNTLDRIAQDFDYKGPINYQTRTQVWTF